MPAPRNKNIPKNKKRTFGEHLKSFLANILLFSLFITSVIVLGYSITITFRAKEIGGDIGTAAGTAAGHLAGSFEGITNGFSEGAAAGTQEGLSAHDTEVSVGNQVKKIGKLEVLSASVVMNDLLTISDKYSTLLAFYGDLTFTVDLSYADITQNGESYDVVLPMPEPTLRIDDKKSEQLASDMKHIWSGSNENGYTATNNSINELTENAEKTVNNYDFLMESAMSSAEKQVSFLIQSATKEEVVIHVRFREIATEE